jgi:hypothetical protein
MHRAELETRMKSLSYDQLFQAFWDSVAHFEVNDLVLFFNESEEVNPISVFVRDTLIEDTGLPLLIRNKLRKPAREAATNLTKSETAFWLVAIFSDGEMICTAVNSKIMAPSGHA